MPYVSFDFPRWRVKWSCLRINEPAFPPIQVKAKMHTSIQCDIIPVVTSPPIIAPPRFLPDIVAGKFAGDGLVPLQIANTSPDKFLTRLHVSILAGTSGAARQKVSHFFSYSITDLIVISLGYQKI